MKLASGMSAVDVAAAIGVHHSTIFRWMDRDDFMQDYRKHMRRLLPMAYSKAAKRLDGLIDDKDKWLALQAAQALMNKAEAVTMGTDAQSGVQITINQGTGSAPVLGMPDRPEEEGN